MTNTQARKRWMQLYQEKLYSLGHPHGEIEWRNADYFFNEGMDCFEAAEKLMKTIKKENVEKQYSRSDSLENLDGENK